MRLPIYLDYMATTPVDPRVAERMMACLTMPGNFGNPASINHRYGWQAKESVDLAREQVAALINAEAKEIVWTSGATESNNLALKGAAAFYKRKGNHIISSRIEHKSVLDTLNALESTGFSITYISPQKNGQIDPADIRAAIRPETILISIMHANNEIGVISPISEIGAIAHAHGIIFHVDAAQTLGKLAIDVKTLPIDLISFSAHKVYGPKGVGALFVRRKPRVRIEPLIHGGGHEYGLRSGTIATHQVVGFGEACRLAHEEMAQEQERILALRNRLWQGVCDLPGIRLNGDSDARLSGNLNIAFPHIEGESLLVGLCDLAISSGSACNSATIEPSYVLRAIGVSSELANSSLRFSIGRFTSSDDIDHAIAHIRHVVMRLLQISPFEDL